MKTTFSFPVIALGMCVCSFLITGCGSPIQTPCSWSDNNIRVDGKGEDWTNLPRMAIEKLDVSFGAANDSANLYLLFRCRDPRWAHSISAQGLTLWFDTTAGKKKYTGLKYCSPRLAAFEPAGMPGRRPPQEMESFAPLDVLPGAQIARISILQSPKDEGTLVLAGGSGGVFAEATAEFGGFTYELSLPLKSAESGFAIHATPGREFYIGVEFGGVDPDFRRKMMPRHKSGHPPFEGEPPSGEGLPPGGGFGRGRRGERMPEGNEAGKKTAGPQEIWLTTTLAVPQRATPDSH